MHCALWGFWTLLITGIRGGVTKIPVLCFLFSKHVLLCFFVWGWGVGGGRWGGGRSCCHNKGLIWLIFTVFFHVKISRIFVWFFSRTLAFIFTYGFLKKFSRTHFCFHGQFFRNFHGRKINFTDGKPKIVENFHGRHFDFHGKKKLC